MPRSLRSLPLRLVLIGAVGAAAPVAAATIHVPADHPTIQAALDVAADGDEVVVAPGTWSANLEFPPRAVTLRSASDAPGDTVLDGSTPTDSGPAPVIRVAGDPFGVQRIRGFTIRRGRTGIVTDFASDPVHRLMVENCRIRDNDPGGGLGVLAGDCEVRDCEFLSNRDAIAGGAIEARGSMLVERCVFRDNVAFLSPGFLTQGGAIYSNPFNDPGATIVVEQCDFFANRCTDYGGAIHLSPEGTATIRSCRFFANEAGICAGAIYLFGSDDTLIENNLLVGNVSPLGAGIGVDFGSFTTIRNNTIVGSKGDGDADGIRLESAFSAHLFRNIVAFGEGYGVHRRFGNGGSLCNDWYGNALGDHVGPPPPDNLSLDPLFCDRAGADYTLQADSPCAPSADCDLVGAFPVGCGPVALEATTWAAIKGLYRGEIATPR